MPDIQEIASSSPPAAPDATQIVVVPEDGKKQQDDPENAIADFEILPSGDEHKSYYSKLSVWLMVLFSGLALGSDG